MEVEWQGNSADFLYGDQFSYVAVFWTPEKNAELIRLLPPIREEAVIATRITDAAVTSEIRHLEKTFPVTPFPNGNQLIGLSMIWAGNQDSTHLNILTADGKSYTSDLSETPISSLLISSLHLGGDSVPLSSGRPSGIYFAELLLYHHALTSSELADIDRYLASKYFH